MENATSLSLKLIDVSNLLEAQSQLEDKLQAIATTAAHSLKAQRCSIMLLSEKEIQGNTEVYLQVFAHYGNLPQSAYQNITKPKQGIAGYVAATGQALLVNDIAQSPFKETARYPTDDNNSFMAAPIILAEQIIGVLNMSLPMAKNSFVNQDLEVLRYFAQSVGQAIHIIQLQGILKSRFVTMAVVRELEEKGVEESIAVNPNPLKLAKLVAKAFFKELTQAGFSSHQIIAIATEVLNLLQKTLDKHRQRLVRDEEISDRGVTGVQ